MPKRAEAFLAASKENVNSSSYLAGECTSALVLSAAADARELDDRTYNYAYFAWAKSAS